MPRHPPVFPLTFLENARVDLTNQGSGFTTTDEPCQVLRPYIAYAQDEIQGNTLQLYHGGTLLIRFFVQTSHPIRRASSLIPEADWTTVRWDASFIYYITDCWPWLTNNSDPNPIIYCIASLDQQ